MFTYISILHDVRLWVSPLAPTVPFVITKLMQLLWKFFPKFLLWITKSGKMTFFYEVAG